MRFELQIAARPVVIPLDEAHPPLELYHEGKRFLMYESHTCGICRESPATLVIEIGSISNWQTGRLVRCRQHVDAGLHDPA